MYVENVVGVYILTYVLGAYSRGVWTISYWSLPESPVDLSPSCPAGLCPCVLLISARHVLPVFARSSSKPSSSEMGSGGTVGGSREGGLLDLVSSGLLTFNFNLA